MFTKSTITETCLTTLLFVLLAGFAFGVEDISDTDISNAIDEEIIGDAAVPATKIDVFTAEGIVTLDGYVNNILAKDRAENIATTVKGVKGVINKIDVSAPFRTDNEIREDINDALLWDPVTETWEISASVDEGVVTLQGATDSFQEKQLAQRVVKGVKGVRSVNNNLDVDYEISRPDNELREEITRALRWDAYVDDALVTVMVDNQEVTLEGTVGSVAEKREATREAWVSGVMDVENNLDVRLWARDDDLRKGKYVDMTDKEVTEAVNDAMLYDPRVLSFNIQVDADDGYVTLRGNVDNLKAKRSAAQDARKVVGVWGVKNQIKVRPNTPSDGQIKKAVEQALLYDPYVERYETTIDVVDGEVYLRGDVTTLFEKARADDVAARQRGVVAVHNQLDVSDYDAINYDPFTDTWYVYDFDWYSDTNLTNNKSDWEIKRDIAGQMYWSPFVDRSEIVIDVEDGLVTLEGDVDTWMEYNEAREEALEGGALVVDNNLEVNYAPELYQ